MKNIVRKLRISKLLGVDKLSSIEREVVDFILNKIKDLHQFQYDTYPNSIFWMNSNGECIFEINDKIMTLYVRYNEFWEVLEKKYNIEYQDIQTLTKDLIEKIYVLKGFTADEYFTSNNDLVETAYKQKEFTV